MIEDGITKAVNNLNERAFNPIDPVDIFVCSIHLDKLEYYYDEELDKVRVITNLRTNTNNTIFEDDGVRNAFQDLTQAIADKMNDDFTSTSAEVILEQAIEDITRDINQIQRD